MITVKEFDKLQKLVDAKQAEANRAEGAFRQLMTRLKKEFGCVTLRAAKAKLVRMEEQNQARSDTFDKAYADFIAKHGDELDT